MLANWKNVLLRKMVLQICSIYGDGHAFLGESFCEDEFGMVKSQTGREGIDGYIRHLAVQVKLKWVTQENLSSRYVTIKPDAGFDVLIVCKNGAEGDVELFGAWEKQQVEAVRKPNTNRINLKDLAQLNCFQL